MTFPRQISLLVLMAFLGLVLSGCQPSDPDSPYVARVTSIAVTPNPVDMVIGGVRSLTVTGTFSDGKTYVVNFDSTFTSSAPAIASVNASTGVVTALAEGSATITATFSKSGNTATATTVVNVSAGGGGGGGDFEDITFDSAAVVYTLTGFGGAEDSTLVPDPTDGSNVVAKVVKSATAELWAGTTVSTGPNQSVGKIPFTATNTKMTVRVYSPRAGIPVRLKVEDAADDTRSVETDALTTQVDTWETLTFDFDNPASGTAALNLAYTYDKVSIFFDFGKTGADGGGGTFHLDDIKFVTGSGAGSGNTGTCTAPCIDFAGADVKYEPFEGLVSAAQSDDPVDATNKVAKFVKGPTGQPWAGATIYTIDATKSVPEFDLSGSKIVTVRVYSPVAGMNIRLKLEDAGNNAIYLEQDVLTTKANEWETLSFDFTTPVNGVYNSANTYDRVSLFPAFSTTAPPASNVTVYFDELDYNTTGGGGGGGGGSGSTGTCAPTNCTDFSGGGIGFSVFENPGGGTVELAEDPNDPTNDVVKFVKKTGDNDYFGTVITGLAGPATLTTSNKTVTLRVYSPAVGTNFLFKLENGPSGAVVEKDMVTTVANAWETLSFDLSAGAAGTYGTVVIFPNGRSMVAADKTMYIDELKFPATGGGGGATAPTDAPTTVIPGDAITIYSDAASIAGLDPFPFWGQNPPVTSSEVTIAGNKSLKYVWAGPTGLYQGIDWSSNAVDVSAKGKLHIDFWTPDIGSVKVSIISPGLENAYTQALTTGGWNSVDIDLSNYSVPNLTNIIQIKLEPIGAGTLYVDNIYFWGTGSGSAECTGGTFTGGVFAADYRGSLNPADGKPPLTTLCGDIGFFYDARFPATALYEFGGISNQVVNPGGINNFYYGFGLQLPAITDGYFGAYVNAPANGIANVTSFTNLRFTLWGPAELFEKSFTPQIQVVMAGPAVAGCGSNSGRSEIQAPLVTAQKIGAASNFVVPLSSFTLKFACSGETTVAEVLAKVAQVNFSLIGTNIQYSVPDTSTPPAYSNGLNVGPISFN